ncbi:MAG TPA: TolC family protein, partial [Verrucomicrobiae bacterium]|nr:TolC family protein [Verrucomicrobiae bacterium]
IDPSRANIMVVKEQIKRADWTLRLQMMNVITLVEQAYDDLIFARENIKVQEKALELSQRLLSENKKKVEVGAMAPLDEKQAESQVAANKANLIAARANLDARQNALRILLTDNYRDWHAINVEPQGGLVAVPETFDLQESWTKGLAQRPDLMQLKADLSVSHITARLDRNQVLPDFRANGGFGLSGLDGTLQGVMDDIGARRNPNWYYGFSLSVPIANRAARYTYRAAKLAEEQTGERLKQLQQNILMQIDDAVKTAQANFEAVTARHEAALYAQAALDAEQKKLENGKSTNFEVLQLQKNLTDALSAELSAITDYNKALAQLALREGSTFERHKLNIQSRK